MTGDGSYNLTDRDREALRFYNEPAPVGAGFGITRYLFELHQQQPHLRSVFPDLGRDGQAYVEWLHLYGRETLGIIDELLPPRPQGLPHLSAPGREQGVGDGPPVGVNVLGHLQAELGIGEAGRLIVAGLDARKVPVIPIESNWRPPARHGHRYESAPPAAAGFPITITCANPDSMRTIAKEVGREFFRERYSVGYWWWEVDGPTPFNWRRNFDLVDEVWVASEYVADAFGAELGLPVRRMKLPVWVPDPPVMSRSRLGLPDQFLFLFMFDYTSVCERKNPIAVLDAFKRSFAEDDGAALVIKCVNRELEPQEHERVMTATSGRTDIRVLDSFVDPDEKNAMLAACDCYVSLHRSEGFGLPLAEAMYFGKPVIATGYSGNLEFMSERNSYLVGYTTTDVGQGRFPYPYNAVWAEPDVEHAIRLMRQVFDDRDAARAVGERAARDIREAHSLDAAGRSMEERLAEIAAGLARERELRADRWESIDRAAALLSSGPRGSRRSARGARAAARRLTLRVIRPFAAHQHMLDEQLLGSVEQLRELGVDLAREARRSRRMIEQQALVRAAELAGSRERPERREV